jgi:hypothetical protein
MTIKKQDEGVERYLQLYMLRRNDEYSEEKIASQLGFGSTQALYQQLRADKHPVCPICRALPVEEGHCESPVAPKRKAQQGEGEVVELPPAANATDLFRKALDRLLADVGDLQWRKEYFQDGRFVAQRDYGVEMSLGEAKEAKRKLLDTYPKIGDWHVREGRECERGNFVTETLMGRHRVVEPDHRGKPSFTERLNAPVQGTAADILKLALARLWESREEYPEAVPILSVHDEVVIECDAEAAQETVCWLGDTLRGAVEDVLGCPELAGYDVVETAVVSSWGEA